MKSENMDKSFSKLMRWIGTGMTRQSSRKLKRWAMKQKRQKAKQEVGNG